MSAVGLWQRWKLEEFGRTEASQIVELAVSLPLLAVVVIGLTDFSGAFNLKFRLSNAVREGARFASNQSTADLSNPTPLSISGVRDVVDNYLVAVHINDCGLSTESPVKAGLTWTYTANTGCPGTLTLTIDRGSVFLTTAGTPVTVEATHVSIQYPYQWRFNRVIRVLIPSSTYAWSHADFYGRGHAEPELSLNGMYIRRISDFTSGLTEECGQEIAEAALVLPILFLILLAIFWFGRAFNIASTVERAARHGIQTATQPLCASCGNTFPASAQIVASISSVLQNDHLNPANLTAYSPPFACTLTTPPTCTTLSNVEICTGVPLTCGNVSCQSPPVPCGTDAAVGERVSFGYRFTTPLPIANLSAITIPASAQTEQEQ